MEAVIEKKKKITEREIMKKWTIYKTVIDRKKHIVIYYSSYNIDMSTIEEYSNKYSNIKFCKEVTSYLPVENARQVIIRYTNK